MTKILVLPLLRKAVEAPLRQIVHNAGGEASVVVNNVKDKEVNYGYNAANETYGDMIEMGIPDPTKVTRSALQHAASIASLMITTEAMVGEVKEDTPAAPAMGRWYARNDKQGHNYEQTPSLN